MKRVAATATLAPLAQPTDTPIPASTPQVTATAGPTSTATAADVATPTASIAAPTATSAPAGPSRLDSVSIRPLTVAAGGTLTASILTSGDVRRAEVYVGSGAPNAPAPITLSLSQSSPGSWTGTGRAPSVAGTYHFTVGIYNAAGRRDLEDNDAWNLQVQGSSPPPAAGSGAGSSSGRGSGASAPSSGAQPLFGDIPLAPPFSYGNPVAAVFNAGGKTVNGSEVVSNSRPDVAASTVGQYYSVHFARNGWTTDGTTVPAGATSFSMSATSGSRVCIAQYSAGTVHIFYGTAAG